MDKMTLEKAIHAYLERTKPDFREIFPGERDPSDSPLSYPLEQLGYWCIEGGLDKRGENKPAMNTGHTMYGTFLEAIAFAVVDPSYCGHGCKATDVTNRNGYVCNIMIRDLPRAKVDIELLRGLQTS